MAIRGILFDFDGTLGNTTPLILATFHKTLEHYLGRDYGISDQEIINTFGLPLREGLARFIGADNIEEKVSYYRHYNNAWHDSMIQSFPEVGDGCAQIQAAGIPQIIVTSKLHDSCLRGLRCIGLDKYMNQIVGCEQCSDHKPNPEPMEKGAEALGFAPAECLCVGDSPFDMMSGNRAGCTTVKVNWTSFLQESFIGEAKPDYSIDKLVDLLDIIQNLNQKR